MIKKMQYLLPILLILSLTIECPAADFTDEINTRAIGLQPAKKQPVPIDKPQYAIQVGAYLIKKNAENMVIDLRAKGYEPYLFKTVTAKMQPLYLVRIGDYPNMKQASFAAAQFKKLEKMPANITRYNSSTPLPYQALAFNDQTVQTPLDEISPTELGTIDGRAGTMIDSDELAIIDGRSGTLMPEDELSRIDGQTGTVMPSDELATVDGQTGTVISQQDLGAIDGQTATPMNQDDLATVDGQTATTMAPGDLATVDGQTATTMATGDLATVDGQTATTMAPGDLANTDGQTASMISKKNLSDVAAQAASAMAGQQLSTVDAQAAVTKVRKEEEPFFLAAQETEKNDLPFLSEESEGGAVDSAMAKQLREQIELLEERVNELREEADVRKILEITEEEKQQEEEEILSATGRDYTLAKKGAISADYNFDYTYNSYDSISDAFEVEHQASHRLSNSISMLYAVRDNVSVGVNIPFVYAYDNMGTSEAKDVTDIGDISMNMQWQPLKAGGSLPAPIVSFTYIFPTGRSPYEINPEIELSTGSGYQSFDVGLSLSKSFDPVMAFGGLSYGKGLEVTSLNNFRYGSELDSVDPGQNINARLGMGYAISYKLTVNIGLNYSYQFGTEYHYTTGSRPVMDSSSASFSFGTGWRLSPKRYINVGLTKGLSIGGADFSISVRVPFNF